MATNDDVNHTDESPTDSTNPKLSSTNFHVDEDLLRPLWIATKIANYPCVVLWIVLILLTIMSFFDAQVFAYTDNSDRTWLTEDNKYTYDYDSWNLARDALGSDNDDDDTVSLPQTDHEDIFTVFFMFKMKDYSSTNNWILTPDKVETIVKYEQMVLDDEKWKSHYCFVSDTDTYECDYFSVTQMIYEHYNYSFDMMTTEGIKQFVLEKYEDEDYTAPIEASFNPEFQDTLNTAKMYRSFLSGGLPTPNNITIKNDGTIVKSSKYENGNDRYETQETKYEDDFALDLWVDITVKHNGKLVDNDLQVVCLIWAAYDAYAWILVDAAFYFIGMAMLAVLTWMTFHLQSFWLSCLGVTGIMLSFPFAYFIYYFIFQVGHFDLLSSMIIFVLLGVGADDIFVFTDAWHQSIHFVKDPNDDVQRMTFTYRRASKAMLVTQTTTFFAFLATAFSKLLPIAAFGIWAATVVATNYILVITMYPSVLMIYHKYVSKCEQRFLCCCCYNQCFGLCKKKNDNEAAAAQAVDKKTVKSIEMTTDLRTTESNESDEDNETNIPPLARAKSVEETATQYRAIERFFGLKWSKMIFKIKYVMLVVFAIIFGVSCWLATGLEPLDESETWFSEDHYMQEIIFISQDFSVSEEDGLVDVTLVWGVKGVDRSGAEHWDPDDYGKVIWDKTFDMSSPDAQMFMYDVCLNLSESDLVYQKSSVICPLDGFLNFTLAYNLTFPWTYLDPDDAAYDPSEQKAQFAELMYQYGLSEFSDSVTSNDLLFVRTPDQTDDGNYYIQYIAAYAYVDLSWDSDGSTSRKRRKTWEDWIDDTFYKNENCPDYVCKPIQASDMWAWLVAQQEFVRSALQGIGIAMPIAFLVLIFSTHNWIVAIFATLDIIGIMSCALAVMALMGWQFGISESLSIVIIIGFSVDYVVHLANSYLESTAEKREERLSFALLTMGVSVASGAMTTFLSGFFMQFPEMQFFYKMGVIILATILWSIIWAMFFFTSILAAFGPEGKTGNIPFEKITTHCKRNKDDE